MIVVRERFLEAFWWYH